MLLCQAARKIHDRDQDERGPEHDDEWATISDTGTPR
jgi:hypothetical protein